MACLFNFLLLLQLARRFGRIKLVLTVDPANLASLGIAHSVTVIIVGKVDDHARLEIAAGIFVRINHDGIGV